MGTERKPQKGHSKRPSRARAGRLKKSSRAERGRPRDEAATAAILEQTILLLAKKGYRGFRLEDVAAEASVSKATVYRRWASKQRLVCDAVRAALSRANPLSPDTGDVRRDVVTVLQGTTTVLNGPLGSAVRALVSEVMFDRELSTVLKQLESERRGILRGTIERARAAGVLAGETELLIDVLAGAAWYQLLVRQGKPALTLGNDVTALLWRTA
ncbi:MAG TPA: TetR/AcrR family transcriptional regulator [Polyangiaceae bacterium]|jgi:AcrR family transcriptional regulator|nr:TetR/AcrR family transcriptional regulator [Polyangiaceae bacterium]